MVCLHWSFGVVSVAFDDGVQEVFATEDVIDSGVVACIVSLEGGNAGG